MRFLILRAENKIVVDNAIMVVNCASLASNVAMVVWDGKSGQIEYNDRPAMREAFDDPWPYQPLINAWMTAQAAAVPALTLAQAKGIKSDTVDGMYNARRVQPIQVTVGAGAYWWDASDESLAAMHSYIVWFLLDSAVAGMTGINAALAALAGSVNTNVVERVLGLNDVSENADDLFHFNVTGGGGDVVIQNMFTTSGSIVRYSIKPTTVSAPAAIAAPAAPGLMWMPNGSGTAVAVTLYELALIAINITNRRLALSAVRSNKKATISGIATVAAAIAYDTNAGWP